jgi:hypothetical protein
MITEDRARLSLGLTSPYTTLPEPCPPRPGKHQNGHRSQRPEQATTLKLKLRAPVHRATIAS